MKIIDIEAFSKYSLVLAKAECCDAYILAKAEQACFDSDPWSEKMFSDALENPACHIYILADMQMTKIVAYAVMYICFDEGDLANIAVIPSERKKGLGAALIDKVMKDAVNTGVQRIFLEVRESNVPARGLYLSKGFKEIGVRKKYYRDPVEDAHIMAWCHDEKQKEK